MGKKSYPLKVGHPPSRVNFSERLYEEDIVPPAWVKGQELITALAHALIRDLEIQRHDGNENV